jgi:TRAP transporter 4TM/12TM fusion protein
MITIPLMKKSGMSAAFAGGVEATASCGGQIMPPVMGAIAFLIADFLDLPYISVCAAAAIPAVLYYVAMFLTIDAEARKKGLKGMPREELPSLGETIRKGWMFILPLAVLLYALIFLHYTAQLSCAIAFATLMAVSLLKKETRWTVQKMITGAVGGARGMIQIGVITGGVGIMLGGLALTGMPLRLSGILTDLAGGRQFPLLLLAALTSLILGMGLPGVACYILLVILAAPALINLGIDPLAAHLFVFYFGVAHFLTPPVALAAYVAAGISGARMMETAFQAMRIGIVIYMIPFVFVYEPALLLKGSFFDVVIAIIVTLLGVISLSSGLAGYLVSKAGWPERILLMGGGILLFFINWKFRVAGFGILFAITLWQIMNSRRFQPVAQKAVSG